MPLLEDGRTVHINIIDHTDQLETLEIRTITNSFATSEMRDVFDGVTLGTILNGVRVNYLVLASTSTGVTAPTDPNSQNEIRWQVNYTDLVTGLKHRWFIPTADLSLLSGGSEFLDITNPGPGKDLKDWLEAKCLSDVGNAVEVVSVELA